LYYPHFGLKEPPFKITPNTDFFFSGGNRGAVLDALIYAITSGEGIVKVVGEVGSGKTMLCRMLQTILPKKIESIYLANPSVAPEDVLHAIAFELQLKLPKNADHLTVMQQLQLHLLSRHAEGRQVVIFVEEAQGMSLATLEEIRRLSNLETKQDKLLQIVLFGQPELDVNLSKSHIRQLRERITHSFYLEPLATKDIGEYLILRLRAAGYHGPHLFSDTAIKKLSSASKGLARRVNILADKSLLAAFADNVYQVMPKHVKAAIQDSEFGRNASDYNKYFVLAIIFISLLVASMAYAWWQYQPQANFKSSLNKLDNKPSKTSSVKLQSAVAAVAIQPTAAIVKPDAISVKRIIDSKQIDTMQSLVDKRIELTRSWLFSGQPNTMTLQIKSLPTEAKLNSEKFNDDQLKVELDKISQQLEADKIYVYRKKQNGKAYTVILYGQFTERSDALAALKTLPEPIKSNQPYLRTLEGINRDIEKEQ